MPIDIETMKPNDRYMDELGREWRVIGIWISPCVMMEPVEGARSRDDRIIGGVDGLMWDRYKKIDRLVIDDPLRRPDVGGDIRAGDDLRVQPNGEVSITRTAKQDGLSILHHLSYLLRDAVFMKDSRLKEAVGCEYDELERIVTSVELAQEHPYGAPIYDESFLGRTVTYPKLPLELNKAVRIEDGRFGVVIGIDGDEVWVRYDEPDSLGLKRGIYTRDQLTRAD